MKFAILTILSFLLLLVSAAQQPQKSYIFSYADNTPNSVINQAMDEIRSAGGVITHEYKLIRGFAAKASEAIVQTVTALGNQYNVVVEEDKVVNAWEH